MTFLISVLSFVFSFLILFLGWWTRQTRDIYFELSLRTYLKTDQGLQQSVENHELLTKIEQKIDNLN